MFNTPNPRFLQALAKLSDAEKWLRVAQNDKNPEAITDAQKRVELARTAMRYAKG